MLSTSKSDLGLRQMMKVWGRAGPWATDVGSEHTQADTHTMHVYTYIHYTHTYIYIHIYIHIYIYDIQWRYWCNMDIIHINTIHTHTWHICLSKPFVYFMLVCITPWSTIEVEVVPLLTVKTHATALRCWRCAGANPLRSPCTKTRTLGFPQIFP